MRIAYLLLFFALWLAVGAVKDGVDFIKDKITRGRSQSKWNL